MYLKKISIAFLLIPLFAFTVHRYYMSLCEIEYNNEQKSVQIILGMFIDDIELTLNKDLKTMLYLDTPKENKTINTIYFSYLKKHFTIKINNKPFNFNYIGKEYDDNIVRFYLEIPNVENLKSIEITNTSLLNYFPDQQNIIKIKANERNKTLYLTQDHITESITY